MRGLVAKELRKMIKQSFRKDGVTGPLQSTYLVSGGQKAIRDKEGNLLAPEITGTIKLDQNCEKASYKFFKQQYKMLQRQGQHK
jgi:hypothetical protein